MCCHLDGRCTRAIIYEVILSDQRVMVDDLDIDRRTGQHTPSEASNIAHVRIIQQPNHKKTTSSILCPNNTKKSSENINVNTAICCLSTGAIHSHPHFLTPSSSVSFLFLNCRVILSTVYTIPHTKSQRLVQPFCCVWFSKEISSSGQGDLALIPRMRTNRRPSLWSVTATRCATSMCFVFVRNCPVIIALIARRLSQNIYRCLVRAVWSSLRDSDVLEIFGLAYLRFHVIYI